MRVIGLISGTSMDAVDVAVGDFALEGTTVVLTPVHHGEHPFPPALRTPPTSAQDLCLMDNDLGRLFADAARPHVRAHRADLVASLGQTVHHHVVDGRCAGTLQLGQPAWIAEATGLPVIADFRVRDVAAGGHGAPLASTLDALWLAELPNTTALNVGGIANITRRTPDGVVAYDTGPGNALLDAAMTALSNGLRTHDVDGEFAARGRIHGELLTRLLADPYYAARPPKSTGKEHFDLGYLERVADGLTLPAEDLLATLTELTARTVAAECAGTTVIGSGGGMRNPALVRSLRDKVDLRTSDEFGLPADGKEAYLAALLGFLAWHGLPANVPAATGAAGPRLLGAITPGRDPLRLPDPADAPVTGLRIGGHRARP
ncbi:anhydro-N-acetylmuramic acid kinase [Actinosynnema sp. NPDC047251]|uniref:Anhydro-N-acetylmuramic acid kinase n=1 Tax=Saccharothrix espanaensis (strain ATCC 51144 / DSM 44229 / JCM 9112 / NBRC 15066 / NRRL 15764) TaxID=1179773 RepID=K0KC11_SACES|nr:anhydro-N-acetylmuramic acid kinase [Saccharothrix espanaensis]CCH34364.1 Anhydro-N-acetylmuramic acid kinase [Saccharothrix espanaensis DSM 44229]